MLEELLTVAELELEPVVVAAELRTVLEPELELERTELVPALERVVPAELRTVDEPELELELERTALELRLALELELELERTALELELELRLLELLLRVTCCAPERVPVLELELRTAPELALEREVLELERVAEELELLLVFCWDEEPALERV